MTEKELIKLIDVIERALDESWGSALMTQARDTVVWFAAPCLLLWALGLSPEAAGRLGIALCLVKWIGTAAVVAAVRPMLVSLLETAVIRRDDLGEAE